MTRLSSQRTPNSFFYELRRSLTNRPLMVASVLLLLASSTVLVSVSQSSAPPPTNVEVRGVYYYSQGAYRLMLFAFDEYGHPAPHIILNATFNSAVSDSPVANVAAETRLNGIAQLNVTVPPQRYNLTVETSSPSVTGLQGGEVEIFSGSVTPPPNGTSRPTAGGITEVVHAPTNFAYAPRLEVFFAGPNGTVPASDVAYWAGPFPNDGQPRPPLPESAMHRLGELDHYSQDYPLAVPNATFGTGYGTPTQILQVEIFDSAGRMLAEDLNTSAAPFGPAPTSASVSRSAFGDVDLILGFLVSIIALVSAFAVYARDRVTGVLDATLCGPVSRVGLTFARYASVVLALGVAITVNVVLIDFLLNWSVGAYLTLPDAVALALGLMAEAAVFAALVFLASRVIKSITALVGLVLGLPILFEGVWPFIVAYATEGGNATSLGSSYIDWTAKLDLLNPTRFLDLVDLGLFGGGPSWMSLGLATAAILVWMVLPLGFLAYHVMYRD